jgi:ABC-type amino acid transport substrate-binding protein
VKKSLLIIALFVIGALFIFWRSTSDKVTSDRCDTLVIGTNAEFSPFTFIKDGSIQGFDIDLANAVAEKLGKKVSWRDMPFDILLLELRMKKLDMAAAGISPSPERAKRVLFTKPYLHSDSLHIVTLAGNDAINNVDDLTGKRVIVNDGFTAESYIANLGGPVVVRIPTVAESFLALTSGRADAYVSALSPLKPFFKQYDQKMFRILPIEGTEEKCVMAFSKDADALHDEVQQVLNQFEEDGTLARLKEKWGLA